MLSELISREAMKSQEIEDIISIVEKFDENGNYVIKYCPELGKLPKKYIHKPWEAPDDVLRGAKIVLGKNYPYPIVDLRKSRSEALEKYNLVKVS